MLHRINSWRTPMACSETTEIWRRGLIEDSVWKPRH